MAWHGYGGPLPVCSCAFIVVLLLCLCLWAGRAWESCVGVVGRSPLHLDLAPPRPRPRHKRFKLPWITSKSGTAILRL